MLLQRGPGSGHQFRDTHSIEVSAEDTSVSGVLQGAVHDSAASFAAKVSMMGCSSHALPKLDPGGGHPTGESDFGFKFLSSFNKKISHLC